MMEEQAMGAKTATPPGRRILKGMESRRGNFYLAKSQLNGDIPRLHGDSGDFIDLDEETPTKKAGIVDVLWQRLRKTPKDDTDGITEGDDSATPASIVEIPGAKLRMLKDGLEPKMRQQRKEALKKRYEEWQREQRKRKRHSSEKEDGNEDSAVPLDENVCNGGDNDGDGNAVCIVSNSAAQAIEDNTDDLVDRLSPQRESPFNDPDAVCCPETSPIGDNIMCSDQGEKDDWTSLVEQSSTISVENIYEDDANQSDHLSSLNIFSDSLPVGSGRTSASDDRRFSLELTSDKIGSLDGSVAEGDPVERSSSGELNTSVAIARKLLGRAIVEGDSQPPTSQEILNCCSGRFPLTENATQKQRSGDGIVAEPGTSNSTQPSGSSPKQFYNIFTAPLPRPTPLFDLGSQNKEDEVNTVNVDETDDATGENTDDSIVTASECIGTAGREKHNRILSDDEDDENLSEGEASAVSGIEENDKKEPDEEEGEDEYGEEEEGGGGETDDEEEAYLRHERKRRSEFFDDEAELSGSEGGSADDNEDGLDEDEWEEEAGDQDDVPDEDELRSQIGRIHWKQMLDEDKRQLMNYKEAFIRDKETGMPGRFRGRRNDSDEDDSFIEGGWYEDDQAVYGDEEFDGDWHQSLQQRSRYMARHGVSVEEKLAEVEDVWGDSKLFSAAKAALGLETAPPIMEDADDEPAAVADTANVAQFQSSIGGLFCQRESLLNRGGGILEKLTKEGDGGQMTVGASSKKAAVELDAVEGSSGKQVADIDGQFPNTNKRRKLFKGGLSVFETLH